MKSLKQLKWDTLLTGALYILLGIVALVIPETMERILGFLIGAVLIIAGAVSMISYLLRDAHQNYYHNDFLHGLLGILLGIVVLYNVEIIISLVPMLLGALVLVSGLSKLQDVIDLKRMEYGNWVFMLVLAIINIALGLLLIFNSMSVATILFRLLGVGLIFSGITDCATTIYFARKIADYFAELNAIDSTFVEIVDEDKDGKAKEGAEKPKRETDKTRGEAAKPEVQAVRPGREAAKPEAQAVRPGREAAKPEAQAVRPGREAAGPEAQAVRPGWEAPKPKAEDAGPGEGAAKAEGAAAEKDTEAESTKIKE